MDDMVTRLAEALERAEHVHGVVSESRGGVDPDWPLFYAWWLIEWSALPTMLGTKPSRSELAFELMRLDREHRTQSSVEPWSRYYARGLAGHEWAHNGG